MARTSASTSLGTDSGICRNTPVDWLGNARGGHVGAIAAATYPALVRSLVMIGAPVATLSVFERARTYLLLGLYGARGPSVTVVGGATDVLLSAQTRAADPAAVRLVQDCLRTPDRRTLRNAVVSVSLHRTDISASLRRLTQPVLVITAGEHTGFTPAQAHVAAELLPHGQVAVVPGASYLVPLEDPVGREPPLAGPLRCHAGVVGVSARVKRAMATPQGAPLRAAYRVAVHVMLASVTGVDRVRFRRDPVADDWVAQRLTVTAKTFLRPATARRFVRSSRRTFTGRVVLADDSPNPMPSPDAGTTVLSLPFASGVAVGRNAAVDAVRTEYVMVSDDDVVMTAGTDLGRAVAFLDEHPQVDAVCATLIEVPRWCTWKYGGEGDLFPGHLPPLRRHGELIGGLPVVLKGPQVYVARTESLRRVRYDEHLRMVDHRDFFSAACGRLVFVSDPKLIAFHARTPFDRAYVAHRDDVAPDTAYLSRKWFSAS